MINWKQSNREEIINKKEVEWQMGNLMGQLLNSSKNSQQFNNSNPQLNNNNH